MRSLPQEATWTRSPTSRLTSRSTAVDRDVNLDVGERVHVASWGNDRTARVSYRGSIWSARLQPGAPAYGGEHIVAAVEGNWLVLVPRVAANH